MQKTVDYTQFLQRFSSKVLWHFTGYDKTQDISYQILRQIIKSRKLKISIKPFEVIMKSGSRRFGKRGSCLCDIPFRDLRIHTARYGQFGIAFHKGNVITDVLFNPVLYVDKNHSLLDKCEKLLNLIDDESMQNSEFNDYVREFLFIIGTYIKTGNLKKPLGLASEDDIVHDNNFYYEREWRSAYDWNFNPEHVAAIMMPTGYVSDFRRTMKDGEVEYLLENVPIIPSEMIEIL